MRVFALALALVPFVLLSAGHASAQEERPPTLPELRALAEAARPALDLAQADHRARLALALRAVKAGQVMSACAELSMLDELEVEGELGQRIARERMRADAWSTLVDTWLQKLLSSGGSLSLQLDGERVKAKVEAIEAGVVRLGKNRAGRTELSLDALEPVIVADALEQKLSKYGDSWLRIYPYALAGDPRAQSLLRRDKSDEVASLKSDARDSYPAILQHGEAALALRELARAETASSPDAAREALACIERVRGATELFASRRDGLAAIAHHALSLVFERDGLSGMLAGEVEGLGEGRVRITYDFEDEAQLEDFIRADDYLAGSRRNRPPVTLPAGVAGVWIEDGDLVTLGQVALKHRVVLSGEQKAIYKLVFTQHEAHPTPITNLAVGLCGLEDGSFVMCLDQGHLYMANKRPPWGRMDELDPRPQVQLDQPYEIELSHDGKKAVRSTSKDFDSCEIECGPRTAGYPFVWTHSMAQARLSDLVFEGVLDPQILSRTRVDWIAGRLAALGLAR